MITEDYVSFAVSKLLKEKGFDEPCIYVYRHDGSEDIWNADKEDIACQKPTLQMTMKWLRENHNIHITGVPNGIGENVFYMGIYRKYDYGWTYISDCLDEEYKEAEFYTPEEACEAAIKYCLENLI